MRKLVILLCLLLLTGCAAETPAPVPQPELTAPVVADPPPESEPEPEPEVPAIALPYADPLPVYLYQNADCSRIVDQAGTVVLESREELFILQDDVTGNIVGLTERCNEGVVYNEYGWANAEKTWIRVYDPEGQLWMELPLNYVSVSSGWIYGYDPQQESGSIYQLEDGALLYSGCHDLWSAGPVLTFRQNNWDAPTTILCPDGSSFTLPEGLTVHTTLEDGDVDYLAVHQDGNMGLYSLDGQELVPCQYEAIPLVRDGCAYLSETNKTTVLRLEDQAVLAVWPYEITDVFGTTAIARLDGQWDRRILVDLDGNQLLEREHSYFGALDVERDGIPELFYSTEGEGEETVTYFYRTDGTPIRDFRYQSGGVTALTAQTALKNEQIWDDTAQTTFGTVTLVDLETGEAIADWSGRNVYAGPVYHYSWGGWDAISTTCLIVLQENELGWTRWNLMDSQGNLLLGNCTEILYRGGGVFQVEQGFSAGLMRIDGTWLYRESTFSALDDK